MLIKVFATAYLLLLLGASYGGSSGNFAGGASNNLACGSFRTPFIMGSAHPNGASGLILLELGGCKCCVVIQEPFFVCVEIWYLRVSGAGGGAIQINAASSFLLNGVLSANGNPGGCNNGSEACLS